MPEEPTTPDLVEVVTDLFEAAGRGDWDAVVRPLAPGVLLKSGDAVTDAVGASTVRSFWEEFAGMFEDFTIRVDSVVDLGNGVVYAVYHSEGRPAESKGTVAETVAVILEWVDGMIARLILGSDLDEARAAAERLAEERG